MFIEIENKLRDLIGKHLSGIYLNHPIHNLTNQIVKEFAPPIAFWLLENIKGKYVYDYFLIDCIYQENKNLYSEFMLVYKESASTDHPAPYSNTTHLFAQIDNFIVEEIRLYDMVYDYIHEEMQSGPELGQVMAIKSQNNEFVFIYAEMGADEAEPSIALFLDKKTSFETFENTKAGAGWSSEHGDYTVNYVLKAAIHALSLPSNP